MSRLPNQQLHFRQTAAPPGETPTAAGRALVLSLDDAQPCAAQPDSLTAPLRCSLAACAAVFHAVDRQRRNGLITFATGIVDEALGVVPVQASDGKVVAQPLNLSGGFRAIGPRPSIGSPCVDS
jgi:hypothetical protein